MKRRKYLMPLMILLLPACAATQPCVNYIECEDGMTDCKEQARQTCPAGYQVMTESEVGADFSQFARDHFAGAASGVPHLIVTCNP